MSEVEITLKIKVKYEMDRSQYEPEQTDQECLAFEKQWAENNVIDFLEFVAQQKGIVDVSAEGKIKS